MTNMPLHKYEIVMATKIEKRYTIEAPSWDEAIELAEVKANKQSHATFFRIQGYDTPWQWEVVKSIPRGDEIDVQLDLD